jgi:hypothetical protein
VLDEEVCPYCDSLVGHRDSYCPSCGERLGAPGQFEDSLEFDEGYLDDPDREILADEADGDLVYVPRGQAERREELKLLAAVLAVALLVLGVFGLAMGWWGRGGSGEDETPEPVSDAVAVEVETEAAEASVPRPEKVDLSRLEGLSVAFRDSGGVHLLHADDRDSVHIAATPPAAPLNGGAVAIGADSLFYVDGATVHRYVVATGEDVAIVEADWVAHVPEDDGALWVVDRNDDDELGTINTLLLTALDGVVLDQVELPAGFRLDGATNRGVIVIDPASSERIVIGPGGFRAPLLATTTVANAQVSPDGAWLVRAEPGSIVARPVDTAADEDFTIVSVPADPTVPVEFVVAVSPR